MVDVKLFPLGLHSKALVRGTAKPSLPGFRLEQPLLTGQEDEGYREEWSPSQADGRVGPGRSLPGPGASFLLLSPSIGLLGSITASARLELSPSEV